MTYEAPGHCPGASSFWCSVPLAVLSGLAGLAAGEGEVERFGPAVVRQDPPPPAWTAPCQRIARDSGRAVRAPVHALRGPRPLRAEARPWRRRRAARPRRGRPTDRERKASPQRAGLGRSPGIGDWVEGAGHSSDGPIRDDRDHGKRAQPIGQPPPSLGWSAKQRRERGSGEANEAAAAAVGAARRRGQVGRARSPRRCVAGDPRAPDCVRAPDPPARRAGARHRGRPDADVHGRGASRRLSAST